MNGMLRVLWVEDSARFELAELTGPVTNTDRYQLILAEDVSSACAKVNAGEYDILIVDIGLPPGTQDAWIRLYRRAHNDKMRAELGLHLVHWLLRHQNSAEEINKLAPAPEWVSPTHIAIFTVSSLPRVKDSLQPLGVKIFRPKTTRGRDSVLLELIQDVEKDMAKKDS